MAQGAPSSVLAGAVTLSGPDTGQSILPIRSRQNSSAYSQVELVKHKKMEGILCKTPWGSVGLSGLPAFITRRALPAALPRAGGNQTPPTWVTQRLVRIGGGCDGSRCPRDSLCHRSGAHTGQALPGVTPENQALARLGDPTAGCSSRGALSRSPFHFVQDPTESVKRQSSPACQSADNPRLP